MAQVVENLPGKHKTLNSNPSTTKNIVKVIHYGVYNMRSTILFLSFSANIENFLLMNRLSLNGCF
jgi:hypothetical protein